MNNKLNKSDLLVLAVYFVVSYLIQGKAYYERGALLREYLLDFPADLIAICSVIFLFVFWLIPKFVKEKKYFLFAFLGLIILIVITGIEYTIGFWSGQNDWNNYPKGLDFVINMIDRGTFQTAFPFALLLTKKFYEGQNEFLKIEKQQKENELKLLRSQLDPHFLFNNLNTLDALIDSNPTSAKEYINRLSLIYRYLIKTKDAEVMELSKEVAFAENYVFLIETRFANDYRFNIVNNTSLNDKFIPTGALQTLLENVVKHNKMIDGNTIETTILIAEDWITVTNTNTSTGINPESLGTGLINLKQRYQLLSDKQIQISDTAKSYKIIIPIIKLSDEK
ncbi:sensor histidine kinase [Winogradskyella ludwigii]|jgi:sensor histidine kinase YesM|uniref:sensor histidine kinase n=1 Tax=Winogradskyella ludwigii TaxID=2686076 RepID=UPI0015CB603F|nr:histidine kinase [Winogradskyella ludwigii]